MLLFGIVFAPAVAALVLALVPRSWLARLTPIVPAAIFLWLAATQVGASEIATAQLSWFPSLGVSLSFFMDGLGLLFALIISGIGTLVLIYAGGYFEKPADLVRFTIYTLIFMTAMLGIVTSSNLVLLFVFWEITSLTSYLLIGFNHENADAREGARRALLITAGGGLALLAGVLLIGVASGTFDFLTLLTNPDVLRESGLYTPIALLIFAGAFSKSAQWPLHFWLPGAMEAPTPASTYLHSATMVKAGVFLLARISPLLNGSDIWLYTLTIIGLITFVYGAVIALRQTDLKAILAYSTVSWLGILVAVQGAASEYAAVALAVGVLAHALYKAALFLMVGNVDHATHTRLIDRIGGLARPMPVTFAAALVAALSMAGIPPLLGFVSKETLNAAALYDGLPSLLATLLPVGVVIGAAFTVTVAFRVVYDTFIKRAPADSDLHPHEANPAMLVGPAILGMFSLGLPFLLAPVLDPLISQTVTAIRQTPTSIHLHLFEGVNTPLIMSIIAVSVGVLLFIMRRPLIRLLQRMPEFDPTGIYQWLFFKALPDFANALTMRLQNGRLHYYMMIVFASFITLISGIILLARISLLNGDVLADFKWRVAVFCLFIIIGAVGTIFAPTRLSAIMIAGIEGSLLSLLFAIYGAPDLAFTQMMIEVVTLVLFVLAFHFLPDAFTGSKGRAARALDFALALGMGAMVTVLILAAQANPVAEPISDWYIENAESLGQGHNVVNILLVDFRGLDTMGEVTVLIVAAIGVTALLRFRPSGQPRGQYYAKEAPAPLQDELASENDDDDEGSESNPS